MQESERDGMSRISTVLAASADQVRSLLDAPALPATFRAESVIGRAEQALDVWLSSTRSDARADGYAGCRLVLHDRAFPNPPR